MPKSFDFPDAKVKLRIEGDQVRVILSGGLLTEGVRLGTSLHSSVGRALTRQHTALSLEGINFTSGQDVTNVSVLSASEIHLTAPTWQIFINDLNALSIDVYLSSASEDAFDRDGAADQVAAVIKAMGWQGKTLNVSPRIEVALRLALYLDPVVSDGKTPVYRLALPYKDGEAMTVKYNSEQSLIWTYSEDVSDVSYAYGYLDKVLKGIRNKPTFVAYVPDISEEGLIELDSVLRDEAAVLYRREDTFILSSEEVIAVRQLPGSRQLVPGVLGDVTFSWDDTEKIASYLNLIDPAGGVYEANMPVITYVDDEFAELRLALDVVGLSKEQEKVLEALRASGMLGRIQL